MEPLLCPDSAMNELKRCRECSQLFDPVFDSDILCNKCFQLEDDPPWDTNEVKALIPPKSEWKNISLLVGEVLGDPDINIDDTDSAITEVVKQFIGKREKN